jgi:hypothetical protein
VSYPTESRLRRGRLDEGQASPELRGERTQGLPDFSKTRFDKTNCPHYYLDEAINNMSIIDLKQFIDLGGVFILAMVLLNQWGTRFTAIEDKLTRMMALLCLAIKDKVSNQKIENVLSVKELKVIKETQ